jgi:Ca2+:H+ antiporter
MNKPRTGKSGVDPAAVTAESRVAKGRAGRERAGRPARKEWPLLLSVAAVILSLVLREAWFATLPGYVVEAGSVSALVFVIVLSAFAIVRHAEDLAMRLGEPYGTLILTFAVTGIEVMMITAAMSTGHGQPALARDAMFSVVMIVLNGMVGAVLLIGGLRYREQTYNLQGINAFLVLIVPLAVLGLILPNFTRDSPGPTISRFHAIFAITVSLGIYAVFLAIQTSVHRHYFISKSEGEIAGEGYPPPMEKKGPQDHGARFPTLHHTILLIAYLLPLVFLSKVLAHRTDSIIESLHAPPALGGFLVAALVLSPESMTAIRAAWVNQLQRSLNILLGSVLATISLTIPFVLVSGLITGQTIYLGLDAANMVMLSLTLVVSILTFSTPRTNILLGAVHLLVFLAYLMLMFQR